MKNVMIVDDSLELGRLLQASLKVLDPTLHVLVVPSAEEAILESSRSPLDLLVTDIRLPGISGIELVRKIRVRRPVVKIMLITGLSDTHLDQQVKELSVDAFFRKPLEIPVFLEAARNFLGLPAKLAEVQPRLVLSSVEKPKKDEQALQIEQQAQMAEALLQVLPEAIPAKTLSDILTDLRHQLGALAALVLDDFGRMVAQAGEPPDSGFTAKVTSAWMAVHAPSQTLGALLKTGLPQSVQAFRGDSYDFVFAPVGAYSLGVVILQGKSVLRLALAFEAVLHALDEIAEVLGVDVITQVHSLPPQLDMQGAPAFLEDQPAQDTQPIGEFLSALENQPAAATAAGDAESFWDNSDAPPAVVSTPDMLTYDQALQLGLTPDEE